MESQNSGHSSFQLVGDVKIRIISMKGDDILEPSKLTKAAVRKLPMLYVYHSEDMCGGFNRRRTGHGLRWQYNRGLPLGE